MDYDTSALTKLREEMRLRQQRHAAGPRPATEAITPQIQMVVTTGISTNTAISHASSRRAINKKGRQKAKDPRAVNRSKGPSVMPRYLALV